MSRRLIAGGRKDHPEAWRLPAQQVEGLISELVRRHLSRSGTASLIISNATAVEIIAVTERLNELRRSQELLALLERADLRPGSITVRIYVDVLAKQLLVQSEEINQAELIIQAQFQMKRRGVELKLHLGAAPPEVDQTLVQNILKGHNWFAKVIAGETLSEIAEAEGVSKRRIQGLLNLVLLAPEILDDIALGEQPKGLTTDYLIKNKFSAVWSEQRAQFATL